MREFEKCEGCYRYEFGKCPYTKLNREVQSFLRSKKEYDCNAFKQKPAPPPPMTLEEYLEKQKEILVDIPEEFHSSFSYIAYDRGHSGSYDECIIHLQDLVSNLKPAIEKFKSRLLLEMK